MSHFAPLAIFSERNPDWQTSLTICGYCSKLSYYHVGCTNGGCSDGNKFGTIAHLFVELLELYCTLNGLQFCMSSILKFCNVTKAKLMFLALTCFTCSSTTPIWTRHDVSFFCISRLSSLFNLSADL